MTENDGAVELSPLEAFLEESHTQLEKVQRGMTEISLLVEQSHGEVEKLAKRNADITGRIHQLQAHFDTVPREDIRTIYDDALDAQQRLFTMRGQLEKLQSDEEHLQTFSDYMARTLQILGEKPDIGVEDEVDELGGSQSVFGQIIQAQEDERRKISRQMHDGPAQVLTNFILQTEIAARLFDTDIELAREELENLKTAANASFVKIRDFIFELRPMMLDDLGLVPTVKRYGEAFKEKTGLDVVVVNTGIERRLESHREVVLFRAIQTLLANVRDHAQATQVKISIDLDEKNARATVEDNGIGFDPEIVETDEYVSRPLNQLRSQIELLGGILEIDSKQGEGARIVVRLSTEDQA
ncbi:MAG: sensor histidine kinase [Anaerolineales bacterium]|nr:MAG: sensor histidine kinase [Anaerolineales bacterium]